MTIITEAVYIVLAIWRNKRMNISEHRIAKREDREIRELLKSRMNKVNNRSSCPPKNIMKLVINSEQNKIIKKNLDTTK